MPWIQTRAKPATSGRPVAPRNDIMIRLFCPWWQTPWHVWKVLKESDAIFSPYVKADFSFLLLLTKLSQMGVKLDKSGLCDLWKLLLLMGLTEESEVWDLLFCFVCSVSSQLLSDWVDLKTWSQIVKCS